MKTSLVSVIIPAYNCEKFINETLVSVINQSYSKLEIVVIDDGSTDGTRERVLSFKGQDSRIEYVNQSNSGVSAARNTGVSVSKGDYIAFLDADDVWLPDNISLKIEKIESGDFGLVHSDAYIIKEDSSLTGKIISGREGFLLNDLLAWKETQVSGPSGVLIKKEIIKDVGLFDTYLSTSADFDFFIRVAEKFKIGRVAVPTWKYRTHSSNMHKNIANMEKDILYVFRKASHNRLFNSKSFERKCYSNMYTTLAASWAGDGSNKLRGMIFILYSIKSYPLAIIDISKRVMKKWFHV
jgi:glycosyltransferase involved in cell wall biosynthesis